MAHAPWYKRYPADFNADPYVQAMTAEQYGWFSAMLDAAWLHTPQGYIPNAIDLLCRMVGRCDEMYFAKHSKIVIDRFKVTEDGKFLYHPKMMEQVGHLSQVSEKRSDAGKKGASKRWNDKDSNCHIPAKQLPTDVEVDSDKDIPAKSDELIFSIAQAYPKLSHLREDEIPQAVQTEIIRCIEADGVEKVLAGVKAYAAQLDEPKFATKPYDFFHEFQYRPFMPKSAAPRKWKVIG